MINLIPNEEKKRIRREFYFRLFIVSLGMLSLSVFIASVSMLPTYFLSAVRKNSSQVNLEIQAKEIVPTLDKESLATIEDLRGKVGIVEKSEKEKFLVSEKIINEILAKKMPDIKITQISYQTAADKSKKININGSAPSRERLLLFRQALEGSEVFSKVDLPISNFIKGSDIQFFLNLTAS